MIEAGLIGAIGAAIGVIIKSLFSRNQNQKDRMEHEENLIKIVKGTEDLTNSIKELDKKVDSLSDKVDTMAAEQKELNVVVLKHDITFAARKTELTDEEKQSILALYDQYKKLGGNSYIESLLRQKGILNS